jgi:serine/threonine protein kinase
LTLASGTRLGPYEVSAKIGVGGIGEVYKATDTNLKRAVAIKVLPASVARNTERLARFQREAARTPSPFVWPEIKLGPGHMD